MANIVSPSIPNSSVSLTVSRLILTVSQSTVFSKLLEKYSIAGKPRDDGNGWGTDSKEFSVHKDLDA